MATQLDLQPPPWRSMLAPLLCLLGMAALDPKGIAKGCTGRGHTAGRVAALKVQGMQAQSLGGDFLEWIQAQAL